MIQCSNPTCHAINEEGRVICQNCQTPLVYRYLWAIGADLSKLSGSVLLTQRYRCVGKNIVLDQTPEYLPEQVSAVSAELLPYLNLANLSGRVPIPHTCLKAETLLANLDLQGETLLLLEQAPLARQERGATLLPSLQERWQASTALRQLNWLRQVAELWDPLQTEGVAATLTVPSLLRVDQSWLRLLELRLDREPGQSSLADLAVIWRELVPTAQPPIRDYLAAVVEDLIHGRLLSAAELTQRLEAGVTSLASAQPVQVAVSTFTDQGPTRHRNEDACYPPSGTVVEGHLPSPTSQEELSVPYWVIVCDGIGGHEGGNVASNMAIDTIRERLDPLLKQPGLSSAEINAQIKQAILMANDAIYSRNNQEHRQARGRMGTTLVLALIYPPFLFIAHVGDSRAYRITSRVCSQITLDDDVAARESRLGYALYRDALRQPSAGSLIQALGITESSYLYPSVQCSLLDDQSLYLICSDGLSDYDRVEAFWWTELRSPLTDPPAVATVGSRLIDLANIYNGHDNVTVGLIALNGLPYRQFQKLPQRLALEQKAPTTRPPDSTQPREMTVAAPPARSSPSSGRIGRLLLLVAGLGILGALGWWFWQSRQAVQPLVASQFQPNLWVPNWQLSAADIVPGSYWQVRSVIPNQPADTIENATGAERLALFSNPADGSAEVAVAEPEAAAIPAGSVLRVIRRQAGASAGTWIYLEICSIPSGQNLSEVPTESGPPVAEAPRVSPSLKRLSEPGDQGWLPMSQFSAAAVEIDDLTGSQQGTCQ